MFLFSSFLYVSSVLFLDDYIPSLISYIQLLKHITQHMDIFSKRALKIELQDRYVKPTKEFPITSMN